MPRIVKSESNIVTIPNSVSVNRLGYVYSNRTTTWVEKKNGTGKRADHKKECIGIILHPGSDWKQDRRMYANQTYYKLYPATNPPTEGEESNNKNNVYEEYPERSDCISVGLYAVTRKEAEESGLLDILVEIFEEEAANLLLDAGMFMLSSETAVFQHFPHWAKSHALFSSVIRSDSYFSRFLKEMVSVSQINLFKKKWALHVLDNGRIYVCYDSTNVNSEADGVFIVQKGHAKDDPDKDQVNTEYAIRQQDGLPITFNDFPGSINDMAEASEIIAYFGKLLKEKMSEGDAENILQLLSIIIIADRGYTSEDNIRSLRSAGIGFILMLKKNMDAANAILDDHLAEVKKPENYLPGSGKFAKTIAGKLFEDDTSDTWFHIVWSADLEVSHRNTLMQQIDEKERNLKKASQRKTRLSEEELRGYRAYFNIKVHEEGKLKVNMRGRGSGNTKEVPGFIIDSFEKDMESIAKENDKCGYMVLVSSEEMTAEEALAALSRRDCVEKAFRALKSELGMDKYGVHFESSMHTKSLIWFISSILRALIFNKTQKLRVKEKKKFTLPALIDQFEEVTADKNLETGKYERRYKLTKTQRQGLAPFKIDVDGIDSIIAEL